MIIIDKPYVSEFLKQTLIKYQFPVLNTPQLKDLNLDGDINYWSELQAIEHFKNNPETRLYTNSENAIKWISENLTFTDLPKNINLFKDKFLFRDLVKNLYPDVYFKSLSVNDFENLDIQNIPKPFIIKPAVGFFSMAVYRVNSDTEWPLVKTKIHKELDSVKNIYPKEVMDTSRFIIESIIEGDEYAIDAYFNSQGKPVILNIMKHVFASGNDFSDRLYITSYKIITENLMEMENFLGQIGKLSGLKNFPLHVEVRKIKGKKSVPIEVNPLRFGAWCTTADATWMAYNYNSIEYFLTDKKPDWDKLLNKKKGSTFAMMVLENSTGYEARQIKSFDYEKLLTNFTKPLELRKINYHEYPVFGFLFAESKNQHLSELKRILKSNLREYVELKKGEKVTNK